MLTDNGWHVLQRKGLRYYRQIYAGSVRSAAAIEDFLVQGVFTRNGGVSHGPWSSLNVGHTVGDDPTAVDVNHDRICAVLDIPRRALTSAQQVHGTRVVQVSSEGRGSVFARTDGLITDVPGITLVLRFADCVPLLFVDPHRPAIGLAHGGWRGTLAGIACGTVAAMRTAFGSRPEELLVGIGPAIGPCCYRVGWDVAGRFVRRYPDWPELIRSRGTHGRAAKTAPYLSLWHANQRQLEAAGVRSIAVAQRCTACHTEEFFSYRVACQDGRQPSGQTGRFAAVIGLRG
jgi:YfiH family protein